MIWGSGEHTLFGATPLVQYLSGAGVEYYGSTSILVQDAKKSVYVKLFESGDTHLCSADSALKLTTAKAIHALRALVYTPTEFLRTIVTT